MSTPPLNEDSAHALRTPNINIAGMLGMSNPSGGEIKYGMGVGEKNEESPMPILEGMNPWK